MKYLSCILFLLLAVSACSSSGSTNKKNDINLENKYPNLVQVAPITEEEATPSQIYVGSVKVIDYKDERALLITGNLANSCTSLQKVTHSLNKNKLSITLIGRMPADARCAMVLTPFTYIFNELSGTTFRQLSAISVNTTSFNLDDA